MSDVYYQMAMDAGYRGDEARAVALQIEETERRRQEEAELERMYEQYAQEEENYSSNS